MPIKQNKIDIKKQDALFYTWALLEQVTWSFWKGFSFSEH